MFGARGSGKRPTAWVGVLAVATATVFALAYRSPGYAVTSVSLNDGGIWVTRNSTQDVPVARFDKPVEQLGYGLTPPGGPETYDVGVFQSGTNVLLLDKGRNMLYAVDPQNVLPSPGGGFAVPSGFSVSLGGDTAAIIDPATGKLWVAPIAELSAASPTQTRPAVVVGPDAAAAVGFDGTVYAVSATKQRLYTIAPGASSGHWTSLPSTFVGHSPQLTVVGSTAVVLATDPATRQTLVTSDGAVSLLPSAAGGGSPVLQQPGPAANAVLVADDKSLYSIPLGGGKPASLAHQPGTGAPAQPVSLGGCDYAAWGGSSGYVVRLCTGFPIFEGSLGTRTNIGQLVFRVNNGLIVLNDADSGFIWGVDTNTVKRLDDWASVEIKPTKTPPHHHPTKKQSAHDRPPIAKPDKFGVRLYETTILHPLDNDSDPDGNLLAITHVSSPLVQIVDNGQELKTTVNSASAANLHFTYTIDDGQNRTATAAVTLEVHSAAKNAPPFIWPLAKSHTITLAGGETVSLPVLADWRDPDGDPVFLSSATASAGSAEVLGSSLIYTAPQRPGAAKLMYVVTDGKLETKQTIPINVLGPTAQPVAPTPEPDVVSAEAGAPVTVRPLENDIPGADPTDSTAVLMLTSQVTAPVGVTATANTTSGTLTLTASHAGTYFLSYGESYGGARTAQGRIRLDVAPPTSPQPPVTMPDVAVLYGQDPVVIDPLANDVDPNGALLSVQSATATGSAPIAVSVEQHRWLVLRNLGGGGAHGVGGGGPIQVRYTVSDGEAPPAEGEVAITEKSASGSALPIATPDHADVRAGSSTAVAVLANDTDSQGEPLSLVPGKLSAVSDSGAQVGAAWAVDGVVRYVAPPAAKVHAEESVIVTYTLRDSSQNQNTGQLFLTIHPASARGDQPPNPVPLEARAEAGQQITIHVPVYNVDPDGDVVTCTGIPVAPKLGRIVSYGPDSIVYQAYPQSGGTDHLTYAVQDPYGEVGTATVRIAVTSAIPSPPPIAVDTTAYAAPGRTVSVDVLANAVIAPGDPVTVSSDSKNAKVSGNRLIVRAPNAGTMRIPFLLTDGNGASSSAVAMVYSRPGFDNAPIAQDDYVARPAGAAKSVTVNVVANDYDPDNPLSTLTVRPLAAGVKVTTPGVLQIRLKSVPQLVPYEVSDGQKTSSVAFVHVPAAEPVGPTLKSGITPIQVPAGGGSRKVSLSSYITDTRGPVRLTTLDTLHASPAALQVKSAGDGAIVVWATSGYKGPGSVSFEVTDGRTLGAKGALTAVFTLPVQVGPATPQLRCPHSALPVASNRSPVSIDLATACLVWVADPSSLAAINYQTRLLNPSSGFALTRTDASGRHIKIAFGAHGHAGQTARIDVSISGGKHQVLLLRLTGPVTAPPKSHGSSSKPPATPGAPNANASNHLVTLTWTPPSSNGSPIDRYEVEDRQGDSWSTCAGSPCTLSAHISDGTAYEFRIKAGNANGWGNWSTYSSPPVTPNHVPAAVTYFATPVAHSGRLDFSWQRAASDGSPVRVYEVHINPAPASGTAAVFTNRTSVSFGSLTNGVQYYILVQAQNAAGFGPVSKSPSLAPFGAPATMAAPTAQGADSADAHEKAITVSWLAADGNGRPIASYNVTPTSSVSGQGTPVRVVGSTSKTFTVPNDGASWTYTVVATNTGGLSSPPSSASSPVQAASHPDAVTQVTATTDNSTGSGNVRLAFAIPATNGLPVTAVNWSDSAGGSGTFNVGSASTGTAESLTVTGHQNGTGYTFQVQACNADGCGGFSPSSNSASPYGPPDTPNAAANANGTTITFSWSGGGNEGQPIANYQIDIDNGGWQNVGPSPGSTQKSGYSYSTQGCVQVRVLDNAGQTSSTATACATTAAAPPPSPTVTVTEGGVYSGNEHYVDVSLQNFAPNTRYAVYLYCDAAGQCNGTSSDFAPYDPEYVTTDGSGNASLPSGGNYWYYGWPNSNVWSVVNNVRSLNCYWH